MKIEIEIIKFCHFIYDPKEGVDPDDWPITGTSHGLHAVVTWIFDPKDNKKNYRHEFESLGYSEESYRQMNDFIAKSIKVQAKLMDSIFTANEPEPRHVCKYYEDNTL